MRLLSPSRVRWRSSSNRPRARPRMKGSCTICFIGPAPKLDSVGNLGRGGLADGSPGAQAFDVVLVEVVLERCWWSWRWVFAGRDLAEAFDVDGDGGQDVLQVSLGLASVAAVAHAVAAGELADGALDAGPDGVALVPGGVLL